MPRAPKSSCVEDTLGSFDVPTRKSANAIEGEDSDVFMKTPLVQNETQSSLDKFNSHVSDPVNDSDNDAISFLNESLPLTPTNSCLFEGITKHSC